MIAERFAEKNDTSFVNASSTPLSSQPSLVATTPTTASSTPKPLGSDQERLQVAADVRHYLREQDIPATVVAYGTELIVTYKYAKAEHFPYLAFMKQQGKDGLRKIADAGFESVRIEAYDQRRQLQKNEISLIEYRK